MSVATALLDEFQASIDHAQRFIDLSRSESGLFPPTSIRIMYAGQTMESRKKEMLHAVYNHLGYAAIELYEKTQDRRLLKRAIAALEPAVEHGAPPVMLNYLARAYFYNHQLEKGLAMILKYCKAMDPKGGVPGESMETVKKQLLDQLAQLQKIDRRTALDAVDYGIFLNDLGLAPEAKEIFAFFAKENNQGTDSYYYAHYGIALSAIRNKEYEKARQHTRKIIDAADVEYEIFSEEMRARSPLKANAYNLLIQSYREEGKEIPVKIVIEGLHDFPNDPILLNVAGVIYDERSDFGQARELFEKGIKLAPRFPDLYINYLDMLLKQYSVQPEMIAEADKLMGRFKSSMKEILQVGREDINELSRIDGRRLYENLVDLYFRFNYSPVLDLLKTILTAKLPIDLRAIFDDVIEAGVASAKEQGAAFPKELLALSES
jgi:tetratricopeptide (TPR) repeat protein